MSELTGCKQSADSASRKRCPSPDRDEGNTIPSKSAKVGDASNEAGVTSESCRDSEAESKEIAGSEGRSKDSEGKPAAAKAEQGSDSTDGTRALPVNNSRAGGHDASNTEKPQSSDAHGSAEVKEDTEKPAGTKQRPSASLDQTDSAAIAAAEALASLTGGDGEDSQETPCSSEKAKTGETGEQIQTTWGPPVLKNGLEDAGSCCG